MLGISANQYRKGMSEPGMQGVSWCRTFWRMDIGFVLITRGDSDEDVLSFYAVFHKKLIWRVKHLIIAP
jgi:hypothetical protein